MKLFQTALCAASLIALFPACTGDVLDVDDTPGASTGGSSTGGSSSESGPLVYRGITNVPEYEGGQDAPNVTLTLTSLTETSAKGTVTFGVAPFDPATLSSNFLDGFPYPLYDVTRTETSLTFRLEPHDVYREWCAAQESLLQPEGSTVEYSCLPYREGRTYCLEGSPTCESTLDGHPTLMVPREQVYGCPVCSCDADGCNDIIPFDPQINVNLRFEADGEQLNGAINESLMFLSRE